MLRLFFTLVVIFTFSCCSSKLTTSKISKSSRKILKERLSILKQDPFSKANPDWLKRDLQNEKFDFKRKKKLKKKILDSLNILESDRVLIIDDYWDSNGKPSDCTYFIYKNKIIVAGFEMINDDIRGPEYFKSVKYVEETTKQKLNESSRNVFFVIEYFDKESFEKISGPITMRKLEEFDITVIINNRVKLYTVRLGSSAYKIKEL